MRAHLLGALLLLASLAGAAETKYNIFNEGTKVGTLTRNLEGSEADGFTDTNVIELEQEGKTAKLTEIHKYDKEGLVSESTLKVMAEGTEFTMFATFGDDGAKVKATLPDGTEDGREIPLATETTRKDPTWFWFKTIKPEVGTKGIYQNFSLQTGQWSDVSYEFKGRSKVTIGDKEIEANEIESIETSKNEDGEEETETTKIFLDDNGDLLVQESDDQKIERIME
ncbi:hypothetical protein EON81_19985 [bacterium]|nr:MAG: hypothetical protein EON81_19985 [bacterium]